MAIIAAFCCALAAIAAKNVNTMLKLKPPNNVRPKNGSSLSSGLPKKATNSSMAIAVITIIKRELNSSFDNTKFTGEAIE